MNILNRITSVLGDNENTLDVVADDNRTLLRNPTRRDVEHARNERVSRFSDKNVIESGNSELGSYDGSSLTTADLSIVERLEVNTSNHISNWKTDMFLGNGRETVHKQINIMPTWDSKKEYMQISRIIIWIVPVAPGTKGRIKAALIDRNKEQSEQIIFEREAVLTDPICFIFYMHWSILKNMCNKTNCPQIAFISDEVYKKGVPFAVANFAWRKVFCNSPIAMTPMEPDVVILNRGLTIRNKALIEAVKTIVPNGNNGKTIKRQIEKLAKSLEAAAQADEDADNESSPAELTFGNQL